MIAIILIGLSFIIAGFISLKQYIKVKEDKLDRFQPQSIKGVSDFVWARSNYKQIDFVFKFPENWAIDETPTWALPRKPIVVSISGVLNKKRDYQSEITFTKMSQVDIEKELDLKEATVDAYTDQELKNLKENRQKMSIILDAPERNLKTFEETLKIHFDKKSHLGNRFARWYSYSQLRPNKIKAGAEPLWVREEIIITKKGKFFYKVRFSVDEAEYKKYRPVFLKAKNSFKFREFSSSQLVLMWVRRTCKSSLNWLVDFFGFETQRVVS